MKHFPIHGAKKALLLLFGLIIVSKFLQSVVFPEKFEISLDKDKATED